MTLDHTPVRRSVTSHPAYRTRYEFLSIPLTSPRVAEACEGRRFKVTSVMSDEVVLHAGVNAWVNSKEVETRIRARIEGRRIVREGMADVLEWLGETP